jgi:predicted TIM-barrel fold metal-dependent hydrolase
MEQEFFSSFPGSLANAVAVHHPNTQVNITHIGCLVFDEQKLSSFPTCLEVAFHK